MAIDLGQLTGNKEVAANNAHAKIQSLMVEILALDTQLKGGEDPVTRAEHDLILGYTVKQFLLQSMKRGALSWLKEHAGRKRTLQEEVNEQANSAANQVAINNASADENEVDGIIGNF